MEMIMVIKINRMPYSIFIAKRGKFLTRRGEMGGVSFGVKRGKVKVDKKMPQPRDEPRGWGYCYLPGQLYVLARPGSGRAFSQTSVAKP